MTAAAVGIPRYKFAWLFSRNLDLAFFFLPILLAPLFFLLKTSALGDSALWTFVAAQTFGIGPFHIGATWFQYFDRENRAYYASNARQIAVFFLLPALLVLGITTANFAFPALVLFLFMAWSIQHLVQQNAGILLLYHNHNRGEAIVNRQLEMRCQHLAAIFFSLIFFERVVLKAELTSLPSLVVLVSLGAVTLGAAALYVNELRKQLGRGAYLNVPALLFFMVSMLSFLPFAILGQSYLDAILITNLLHFAQYIGLMYVLVKRKYQGDLLSNLPAPAPIFFFLLAGLALAVINIAPGVLAELSSTNRIWLRTLAQGVIMGTGMAHYLQDAFMWRFREPFNRKAILNYLRGPAASVEQIPPQPALAPSVRP